MRARCTHAHRHNHTLSTFARPIHRMRSKRAARHRARHHGRRTRRAAHHHNCLRACASPAPEMTILHHAQRAQQALTGSLHEYFVHLCYKWFSPLSRGVARPSDVRRRPGRSRHGSLSNPGTHHMSLSAGIAWERTDRAHAATARAYSPWLRTASLRRRAAW